MSTVPGIDARTRQHVALRDRASAVVGVLVAIVVHIGVAAFGMRAGAQEGNIARRADQPLATPEDEQIIEGALLRQGGGGNVDPRHVPHRVVPIRAEERAQVSGSRHTDQPVQRHDAGVRRDPNSLVTERDIMGRGNQDLAERLRNMAANENAENPSASPGPGAPDGSIHGTETDPNRAGAGAQAKIRSFLQNRLHLLATAPTSAHRPFLLRISISSDGNSIVNGSIVDGSGDETVDSDLTVQIRQLAESHDPIPELTDDDRLQIAGRSYRVRYVPD